MLSEVVHFMSTADRVRSAARDYTRTEAWLKTDPQMPKSIWWYSDCFNVGFRVVVIVTNLMNISTGKVC